MTREEERIYLTNLLIDSTAWSVSEGESRSAIELEVIDRLRSLQGQPSINVVGKPSDEVLNEDDYKALEAAKLNDYIEDRRRTANDARERWKADKTRVMVDGKLTWKPLSQCRKVPRYPDKPNCNLFKWIWVGENSAAVDENLPTKAEQEEAMWAEHDRS